MKRIEIPYWYRFAEIGAVSSTIATAIQGDYDIKKIMIGTITAGILGYSIEVINYARKLGRLEREVGEPNDFNNKQIASH